MLMDIKCSAVSSVLVCLTFDDMCNKEVLLSHGDLVDVEYNANGLRKHIVGKIIKISTVGTDPKGWYIIVDGSDDFASEKARFSPMSILNVEVLRKGALDQFICTPIDNTGIPYLRIVKGRLQWSRDGIEWHPVRIDGRDIIEDQEGTVPVPGQHYHNPPMPSSQEEVIEDAVW